MSEYEVEIVYRVHENGEGNFIEVLPSGDFPGNVRIRTTGESQEYFGKFDVDLPWQLVKLLGETLIKAAADAEKIDDNHG